MPYGGKHQQGKIGLESPLEIKNTMRSIVLRLFFDPGSGTCLWAASEMAKEMYDYPVAIGDLPITSDLKHEACRLVDWYDESMDWSDPGGVGNWDAAEWAHFHQATQDFLTALRNQLSVNHEIVDDTKIEKK